MSAQLPVKAVAVGEFDGVHLGHQAVFAEAVRQAKMLGGTAAGVTFEPRVDRVLACPGAHVLGDLGRVAERKQLMLAQGLAEVAVLEFNSERAQWQPERFLQELRRLWPTVEVLVAGEDFTFGAKGAGNARNFREIAILADDKNPIRGVFVPAVRTPEGQKVSSSQIREALLAGNVVEAAKWLGRRYQVRGHVVHGRAVGRTWGIPTANLEIPENILVPGPGVYGVDVELADGSRWRGGAFIKDEQDRNQALYRQPIEVHLLDFSGDLYGTDLIVEFRDRIRGYRRFASAEDAERTIKGDLEKIAGEQE